MLYNVPNTLNRMIFNVVANHPNAFSCEMLRRIVTRSNPGEKEFLGRETMGGAGVLDTYDEEDYTYEFLGLGYALPTENFQPSKLTDHKDANIGPTEEFSFLIVPQAQSGEEGFFIPKTHDVMYLLLGEDPEKQAKLAFEIIRMETTSNIPPYTNRWICNRRDDMHISAQEVAEEAARLRKAGKL